jgi:hypothetical protein
MATVLSQRPLLHIRLKGYAGEEDRDKIFKERKALLKKKREALEHARSLILSESYGKELIQTVPEQHKSSDIYASAQGTVSEDELLRLATERKLAAETYLTKNLKISKKQVVIDPRDMLIPAGSSGRPGNRIDMLLELRQ